MRTYRFIVVILTLIIITSCNQIKLNNSDAEALIKKTLELPQKVSAKIAFKDIDAANILQNNGLLTWQWEWVNERERIYGFSGHSDNYKVTFTQKGNPYFLGVKSNRYTLTTNDIDIKNIVGISINKEEQTATVRFALISTNITPVGEALKNSKNLPCPLNTDILGELLFKKFDSGWQLQSGQNKTSTQMVNEILNIEE